MLTFHFTGVDGSMTECETLTSGMVGKQIRLTFDESWAVLSKTVVFRAGEVTRVVMDPGDTVIIPADVLARPFGKLFVGVYGTDESGAVVIPTIMAEGPMIRYGADPIEDETAKDLPVWENLQNQIGNLSGLATEDKSDLVSAVNELAGNETNLSQRMDGLEEAQSFMGRQELLETEDTATLVGAVNEINSLVTELSRNCIGFNVDAAQMLVDILSKGLYTADQKEQIDALAAVFGVTVSEDLSHLIHYWDFRTGSLTDRIGGLEATVSEDVTLDATGAHVPNGTSYIMFPVRSDGSTLAGHTAEIKFGEMTLSDTIPMRFVLYAAGNQPALLGLQWTVQRCWSASAAVLTEFTDLQMFSGKTLVVRANEDASLLEWSIDGQLIASAKPSLPCTHLSIGSTANGAFPMTVEHVRIYPNT